MDAFSELLQGNSISFEDALAKRVAADQARINAATTTAERLKAQFQCGQISWQQMEAEAKKMRKLNDGKASKNGGTGYMSRSGESLKRAAAALSEIAESDLQMQFDAVCSELEKTKEDDAKRQRTVSEQAAEIEELRSERTQLRAALQVQQAQAGAPAGGGAAAPNSDRRVEGIVRRIKGSAPSVDDLTKKLNRTSDLHLLDDQTKKEIVSAIANAIRMTLDDKVYTDDPLIAVTGSTTVNAISISVEKLTRQNLKKSKLLKNRNYEFQTFAGFGASHTLRKDSNVGYAKIKLEDIDQQLPTLFLVRIDRAAA